MQNPFTYFARQRALREEAYAAERERARAFKREQAEIVRLAEIALRQQALDDIRAEREHQLAMIREAVHAFEAMAEGQTRAAELQSEALIKLATAVHTQGAAFAEWLKSFQINSPPESSVVTEEDEYREEQQKLREQLGMGPSDDPEDVPEEFRLALELQRDFIASVRGDNNP